MGKWQRVRWCQALFFQKTQRAAFLALLTAEAKYHAALRSLQEVGTRQVQSWPQSWAACEDSAIWVLVSLQVHILRCMNQMWCNRPLSAPVPVQLPLWVRGIAQQCVLAGLLV